MRTLNMTSLNHLNHLLGGIYDIKELMMRSDHLNNIHSQIPRLPLHIGDAEGVVNFHVH